MTDELRTSKEWWDTVKISHNKLTAWLKDQYHGEVTAASRIRDIFFNNTTTLSSRERKLLEATIQDELLHAEWVGGLLHNRGITAEVLEKESRYWNKVLTKDSYSKEEAAAIGYHAEKMRLERIRVICYDPDTPKDIREVFLKILPMEEAHVRRFSLLTNPDVIKLLEEEHNDGLNALGLVV